MSLNGRIEIICKNENVVNGMNLIKEKRTNVLSTILGKMLNLD